MPVIFNIYAIVQILIGGLILAFIQWLIFLFGSDYYVLGGEMELFISVQFLTLISAYLDVKGFKGSLFYLPTWLTLLIVSIISTYTKFSDKIVSNNKIIIYLYAIVFVILYIRFNRKELKKIWANKRLNLELLNSKMAENTVEPKEFWAFASKIYFKPSNLFLFLNVIWSIIYSKVIDGDEFLKFYRDFLDKVELYDLDKERHERWVSELKHSLDYDEKMKYYSHRTGSLTKLATVINHQNDIFGKT